MEFNEQLRQLSLQIAERKNHVTNEETTKQSLIIPFIQLLGYDVFNPLEVKPEYSAEFAKKKGARVDYAIFREDDPLIFFETKPVTEKLEKYNSQLAYYFNSTHQLRLAVLTNGLDYYFFTDLNVTNVMDDSPFFRFNILSISNDSVDILNQIRKENFNTKSIFEIAEELVYKKDLDAAIARLLKDPTNEFIRFILKEISISRITATVLDKFRPMVRQSILDAVEQIYLENSEKQKEGQVPEESPKTLTPARSKVKKTPEPEPINERDDILEAPTAKEEVAATMEDIITDPSAEDLEIFQLVAKIFELEGLTSSNLSYVATPNDFTIHLGSSDKWVLSHNLPDGCLCLPFSVDDVAKRIGNILRYEADGDNSRIFITEPQDTYKLAKLIARRVKELG